MTRPVHLTGSIQKGPFVLGSAVRVYNLDAHGSPTGASATTSTRNDLGQFELDLDASELIAIEGTGRYYNEATGALSAAPVTLRAIQSVPQAGAREVSVNTITHVTFERVATLMGDGASFDEAHQRAEWELQLALGIAPSTFSAGVDAVRMNLLGGDSDANSYLFAVSSVLAFATQITDWQDQAAALQDLLDRLAFDLEPDGEIDAALLTRIAEARLSLPTEDVEAAFAERLRVLEVSAMVPDLDRSLDHDGDGLTSAVDNCLRMPNPGQQDTDGDGLGDACDDDLPRARLCVYVPAIATGTTCNPKIIHLQCASMRTGDDGIRVMSGGSVGFVYEGWLETPDFPIPDCARTPPDVAAQNWLVRAILDDADNPTAVIPLRALRSTEFQDLPHPPSAPNELVFDDGLPARLQALAASGP